MKFTPITDDFWIGSGRANVFLYKTGQRLILIDTGFPREGDKILKAAGKIGEITDIILSHIHIDHTGNAADIAAITGAKVWMHPADAALLAMGIAAAKGTKPARLSTYIFGPIMMLIYGSKIEPIMDTSPLNDGDIIGELGGMKVHHLPGHSDGQIALEIISSAGKSILFAADVIGNFPKIGLPYAVLDKDQMHASIKRLADISKESDVMVFGHGKPLESPYKSVIAFSQSL